VYVKIIASQKWNAFWDTVYPYSSECENVRECLYWLYAWFIYLFTSSKLGVNGP